MTKQHLLHELGVENSCVGLASYCEPGLTIITMSGVPVNIILLSFVRTEYCTLNIVGVPQTRGEC